MGGQQRALTSGGYGRKGKGSPIPISCHKDSRTSPVLPEWAVMFHVCAWLLQAKWAAAKHRVLQLRVTTKG